jgi:hypothetical protein
VVFFFKQGCASVRGLVESTNVVGCKYDSGLL